MPPTISDLPTLDEIKQGPVNSLGEKDLLAIAIALKLLQPNEINNKNDTVTALKKAVLGALQTTSDTSFSNSRSIVQPLLAEQLAHLKLLTGNIKTDPPPQYRHLYNSKEPEGQKQEGRKNLRHTTSDSSLPVSEDGEIDKPSGPAPPAGNILHHTEGEVSTLSIKVSFSGIGTGSREVWILPSQRDAITVFKGVDGKYTTSSQRHLSNLVLLKVNAIAKVPQG
ncbi:hypothetical protein B0H13DRAFT_2656471 [Mycena leptocephala]|nr:hypothetical protein B0H13DRAFT_2656471 [Mycena leptocephala]